MTTEFKKYRNLQIKMFSDRWIEKASKYDENNLSGLFDKFFSLFVAYNSLYNYSTQLYMQGKGKTNNTNDNTSAITYVGEFLSKNSLDKLVKNLENEIPKLKKFIDNNEFNICFSRNGDYQENQDRKISDDLLSKNPKIVSLALLKATYKVRCNMFHGNKDYESNQMRFLKVMCKILNNIVTILYNQLFIKEEATESTLN